jgi:hypothetical protein
MKYKYIVGLLAALGFSSAFATEDFIKMFMVRLQQQQHHQLIE